MPAGVSAHSGVSAPLDQVPLYAKSGSILALGPPQQYVGEKAADPLEIRVYDGADASWTLYEDDGVSADFDASSTVTFTWTDANSTLTISAYSGNGFPGLLHSRTFNIVRARPGHGVGYSQTAAPDRVVDYTGKLSLQLVLPSPANGVSP